MKKIITICAAILMTASMFAQSPEKMSYQAVVRDGSDALITSTAVGMQISILQGTANGNAVYVETQTPTANANGLVSLEIGTGTTSDDFTSIDWATGPYFIKTETDPSGGISYSITGTSQLMSVPYALYAKTSENGITAEQTTAIETNTTKVGYTEALVSANTTVAANTAKTGITTAQAEAIVDNTAKVGVKNGTTAGEMQYWNGTDWVSVAPGKDGQMLSHSQGVPAWKTVAGNTDIMSSTGQIWMDRNLGASQVATSSTDADAYGDLYQWGRAADGHEKRNSALYNTELSTAGVTDFSNNIANPWYGKFILRDSGAKNWFDPDLTGIDNLWQGVNGANNPCPSGYRVPTRAEWQAELGTGKITNAQSAFEILKLPLVGYRREVSGTVFKGNFGYYWSSTVIGNFSRALELNSSNAKLNNYTRANGDSVRCLKD